MTLPIQPLCGDSKPLPLRGGTGRRRACLSAAWADPPTRREKRRAICSWSVGYGTLTEGEEATIKVAENATLIEPRNRRLNTVLPATHSPVPNPRRARFDLLTMPGLKSFVSRSRNSGEQVETSAPLVRRDGSVSNLIRPTASLASIRKCETVLALTSVLRSSSSSSSVEPMQPVNRLRVSPTSHGSHTRMCSRCSSLLTLASSSRYSLNSSTGGFVPVADEPPLLCKLCLVEVPFKDSCQISQCNCSFCVDVSILYSLLV